MRKAETILNIVNERGQRGLPLEGLYRLLFQRDLYLRAYAKLYRNAGAMTPGVTPETVDGMSLAKINAVIEAVRFERYRWTPVRRTYIPKKNGSVTFTATGVSLFGFTYQLSDNHDPDGDSTGTSITVLKP